MKLVRPGGVCVLAFAALAATSCTAWRFLAYRISPESPALEGAIALPGLARPVTVVFDRFAVPHVTARSDADLYFAVGYLHARERLFQMELLRAIAYGRVSEMFGNNPRDAIAPLASTLAVDRWFRVMGLGRAGDKAAQKLTTEPRAIAEAYVAGVNRYIAEGDLPIEFRLLEHTPEPWTAGNMMAIARLNAWYLSMNMPQELIRYLLRAALGEERQTELFPPFDHPGPYIIERSDKDYRKKAGDRRPEPGDSGLEAADSNLKPMACSPKPSFEPGWEASAQAVLSAHADVVRTLRPYFPPDASNNWVVGPSRSASGKPILANDPHLQHSAPGVFYLMHLVSPTHDVIGVTMPGTPAVILGHNRHVAWALTTTFADVQDIYLEKVDPKDPGRYLTPKGSEPFTVVRQIIREKTGARAFREHPFDLRFTRHGAVLSDVAAGLLPKDAPVLALRTTFEEDTDEPGAVVGIARAKSVAEIRAALAHWGVPIQNWVVADDAGHIGYFAAGLVPKRKGWDGTHPVPGWTGQYEWDGFIPYDELPQMWDPPSGMIVTANNKVVPPGDYPWPFTFDAVPGYRAQRIVEVLRRKDRLAAEDMQRLQTDVYVKQADHLLPALLGAISEMPLEGTAVKARDILAAWDRNASLDSVGVSIFFSVYREAWELTLKDDLPPEIYKLVCAYPYASGFFDRLWAERPESKFFDLKESRDMRGRDPLLRQAFLWAVRDLSTAYGPDPAAWTWGKMHTLTFEHVFGEREDVRATFNVGPFPLPGAHDTVWEAGWFAWDAEYTFSVRHGPAFRHVIDLGAPREGGMVVDLGQSGRAATRFYDNAFETWRDGRLWPLSMDEPEYALNALGKLYLVPAGEN